MKDKADKSTGNLLQTAGAKRQAEFKARKIAEGFKRSTVWIKQDDFLDGRTAAEFGSTNASDCPEGADRLSWMLGYCEELERVATARAEHLAKRKGGK